jgi:hypothetical protein
MLKHPISLSCMSACIAVWCIFAAPKQVAALQSFWQSQISWPQVSSQSQMTHRQPQPAQQPSRPQQQQQSTQLL